MHGVGITDAAKAKVAAHREGWSDVFASPVVCVEHV
jgi:hypothetical protein